MKRFLLSALWLSLCIPMAATWGRAEDAPVAEEKSDSSALHETSPMLEGVDIPTAEILDPKTFSTSFRFYSEGGLTTRLLLGPFKRLNLGLSLDAQRLIGGEDPHMVTPAVFLKLRFFDGTDYIPALAFGYDNQGYLYKDELDDYSQPERGLYLAGSHEIFIQDFNLHAGVNFPRIGEDGDIYGFFGATWKLVPTFALLAEYDNLRDGYNNRLNLGGRLWLSSFINVDFAARNVGRSADRGAERIARINYVASFPF